jgi:RNA polymerase sigma-70 factor (ECF subfamily)
MSHSQSPDRARELSTPPTSVDRRNHAADLELVTRARSGDADAIARLVERMSCVPAMLRDRHRRLGNPLSPEELAEVEQETLTALWSKLAVYEGRASLETWAYRFMVFELHKGLDRRHRERRLVTAGETALIQCIQPEPGELEIDPAVLHDGLARVGQPSSDIIHMRHFGDLSFEEIAEHLGEAESTIKARYYRGLIRLRVLLAPFLRRFN